MSSDKENTAGEDGSFFSSALGSLASRCETFFVIDFFLWGIVLSK